MNNVKISPEDKIMGRDKENLDKWRKNNQKRIEFYINTETEKDVLEWIEKVKNKRQYLINLIKGDMNGHKKPTNEED